MARRRLAPRVTSDPKYSPVYTHGLAFNPQILRKTQIFLVTGGAGFIGSHLTARLLAEGACVRVLDDFSTGSLAHLVVRDRSASDLEVIRGDIRDLATVPWERMRSSTRPPRDRSHAR